MDRKINRNRKDRGIKRESVCVRENEMERKWGWKQKLYGAGRNV